ncbi:hypothetical protein [Streptomyces brevispora]|uniref:hypothetical protein n=1 Tax=Streptomyces brevispora TaxID=887462 RepID=UPI0035DFA095
MTRLALAICALTLATAACSTSPAQQDTPAAGPSAATAADTPSVSAPDRAETSTPKADPSETTANDGPPGGSINRWVKVMTGHGIKWSKENTRSETPGPETRNWLGETPGATLTAFAITTPDGEIVSLSCGATGVPEGGGRTAAVLSDCVTAAGQRGVDKAAISGWIGDTLPPMLAEGDFQVQDATFGQLNLTMDATGDVASVEISEG